MPRNKIPGILAFVPDLWEDHWETRHHILSRLTEYYKVLWISPPLYWAWILRKNSKIIKKSKRALKKISPSFWYYAPQIPANYVPEYINTRMPAWACDIYNRCWTKFFIIKIKRLIQAMNIDQIILYIWRPEFAKYVGKFNEILTCYHIDDEYTFDPNFDHPISDTEKALIKNSDIVFIHSKTLLNKKGHLNSSTYYIPNGVNFTGFQEAIHNNNQKIREFGQVSRPLIGHVGNIKRHIDLKLILELARKKRNWSIVLIGQVRREHTDINKDIDLLRKENNVYFSGPKKYQELPNYITQLDVCLMCYKKTEYTKYIYPLKLHEYLACGKPVVSTRLPNLEEFRDVLYFADDVDDWIKKIEKALDESDYTFKQERIAVAKKNSWDARVTLIRNIFENKINSELMK